MARKNTKKIIISAIFAISFFFCASFWLVDAPLVFADDDELTEEEKEELEEEQEEAEEKIEEYEEKLEEAEQEKAKDVQKQVVISNQISQINSNINVLEGKLSESEQELSRLELEIKRQEEEIAESKRKIASILRSVNQADLEARLAFLGKENSLAEYFIAVDTLGQLEGELQEYMEKVRQEKSQLEGKKKEEEDVIVIHNDQKGTLESERAKKNVVLSQTQSEIDKHNATIGEIQSKLNKVQRELSALLGEGYDAEDIEDAVKYASKKTGVRKDFLMGMLVVESDLGRYTGGCDYKESRMSSYRKKLFKEICEELDYNYKKMKVSCPPSGYVGTGGAMGVAQFMSDTWMGYKDIVASRTGHDPPDPWDLTDGVMAMASKLANDGATKKSGECRAAMRYLGGSHQWYCDKVKYWADHYEKLID